MGGTGGLELAGIKFRLAKWEALNRITDRWVVDAGGGKRYTKIHILADGRIGCRRGLKLIYRTQQQTKKRRRLRKRHKLIEQIRGEKMDIGYVEAHPDFVPERRHRKQTGRTGLLMRKGKYYRLRERLLYPDRKAIRQQMQRETSDIRRLLGGKVNN